MPFKVIRAQGLKWAGRAGLALLALAVGLCLWFALQFAASKPRITGEAHVAGLLSRARIVRDAHGVPHIFGANTHDVYFALGYTHAQDRFFQMDLTRRSVEGTLSELVGGLALRLDTRARTENFNDVITAQTAALSPPARAMLDAYAQGVNAQLAAGAAAPEYALLFLKPAPWRVEDTVAIGVAMTNNLTVGTEIDLGRAELAPRLSAAKLDQFFPSYPDWAPRSIGGGAAPNGARTSDRPAPGSNAWALAGARTASGKPLLANDPHLDFSAPGPFYLVHLRLPDGNLVGATLPGAPVIVIGRNDHLAWTNTTNEIDSADLVLAPQGGFANVRMRTEKIVVRDWFGFHHTKTITARDAPLGPLLDAENFNVGAFGDRQLILHSAALDRGNRVIDALVAMNAARDVDAFAAASAVWTAPMTHVLVGSTSGDIGLVSTGSLPLRDKDGVWIGAVPRAAQPNIKNPPAGFIATANNLATPGAYPYPAPGFYTPYRIARIDALLAAGAGRDVAAAGAMQRDVISVFAARVAPTLARGAKPKTPAGQRALRLIAAWDGDMAAARPEPLIFAAWLDAFSRALYADDIANDDLFALHAGPRRAFLDFVLNGAAGAWCDDLRTRAVETCADLAGPALDAAVRKLQGKYGEDSRRWRWGAAHHALFMHPLFGGAPLIGALFDASIAVGGDGDTIFASEYFAGSYAARHGPGLRAIFDLSDLNRSRFIVAPGQSGHPLSPYYRDLLRDWAAGRSFEVRDDVDPDHPPAGYNVLMLTPKS